MRHRATLAAILLALCAALVWSEIRKVDAPVGPQPILNFVADTQRELTRLPVSFARLSDADEIKIGNNLERMYGAFWTRTGDDEANRALQIYVQQVGAKLAAHAHRKLPYRFHYIPGLHFVNAFALPGGPVYIGGGLMALMETEDALAAVLGHEIQHIDRYHCAERVQIEQALRHAPLGGLAGLPVEIFMMGYSKDQEFEADREGAKLAAAASYSPQGAIGMFEAFARAFPAKQTPARSPQEEMSRVALETLAGYFRSHPLPAERIAQINQLVASGQLSLTPTTPLPVAYYFLRERAWEALAQALPRPPPNLPYKMKRAREAERTKQFQEALKLANQSLAIKPDQPRAFEIRAIAQFSLGDYASAAATYRSLLPSNPNFAAGVHIYATHLAREDLDAHEYAETIQIAKQILELQPDLPGALEILAEAQLETSDFSGAAEAVDRLIKRCPREAGQVRQYADRLAAAAWTKHDYTAAAGLAAQSLAIEPDQREALLQLAQAQFALANFQAAADAYRHLLDGDSLDITHLQTYADALSAASPTPQTARAFQAWLERLKPPSPVFAVEMRVELAGLMLMAGDQASAQPPPDLPPESLGRLGWWCYRAGRYDQARALLNNALTLRPGDQPAQNAMAWTELTQQHLDDAIRRFSALSPLVGWSTPSMGLAIARWQAHQTADALKGFEATVQNEPEWRNPRYVQALFPPPIARSIAEMDAESQRKKK